MTRRHFATLDCLGWLATASERTFSSLQKRPIKFQWHGPIYYIKLQRPFVCLSVCTPPFSTRQSNRNQIWHTYSGRYRTHSQLKQIWPTPPQGGPMGGFRGLFINPGGGGRVGVFGGSKNKKFGKFHELPRKSIIFIKTLVGVGWKF